ncbi:MAG TPA: hypothetical protein VGN91_24890 [Bosea sp. (in: a-proteobacteria)]|jgi:integrase|uniref:hypothetical protein n=1 Tax=unclassified Bosea (in: a-proteobacteria) TaxID=2653178 RepID=UPI0008EB0EE3|nr:MULTISPECIES: hypothetical protein [unclassified Bosea (in: a-proteobacteria)]MBR3193738.1 hypothetical protein [Bosea sp. (in: a-proteobacteria)]SFD46373.1 hypothetical protein SAMN05428997_12928 [Bosea sp. CRIB-10]HEV7328309.1 hypothetical protein [Bosea sp. (in: a-proteobacteria)]
MSLPAITRTATTETRYLDRFGQLWRRAGTELDRSIRVLDFVRQFLIWAPQLSGSSVRQYRATIRFGLERLARHNPHLRAEVAEALTLLDGSRQQDPAPAPRGKPKASIPLRTSASKAKGISDADFDRIIAAAPLYRSQYNEDLVGFMRATIVTGHRPIEWHGTTITITGDTLIMIVPNAKNSNDRAHGPTRTLIFEKLDPVSRDHLLAWTERVNSLSRKDYQALLERIEERMHIVTRALFPRRKRWPTPYSLRHACSGRLKRHFIGHARTQEERDLGAAIVAALMGHAADDTASHHYGSSQGSGGRSYPIPKADPEEVARIRPKLAESRNRMRVMIAARRTPAPR